MFAFQKVDIVEQVADGIKIGMLSMFAKYVLLQHKGEFLVNNL